MSDSSGARARKLSNKLTKKRPTVKSASTPPSFREQHAAGKDDTFVEAVFSNLDMIVSKGYETRGELYRNALAERSPAAAPDLLTGSYSNPTSSHQSPSNGEYSSGDRLARSLKRASSLTFRGGLVDPFRRGPPVIIDRTPPGLGKLEGVLGSAAARHADEPPLKAWTTPEDPTETIIALYRTPAEDSSASKQTISRGDPTYHPPDSVPAEKDDTVIALYKPPAHRNLLEPGNGPPLQSDTIAASSTALTPAAIESTAAKVPLVTRSFSQRSPNAVNDVPTGSPTAPPLPIRSNETRPRVQWQHTPLKRSETYSREYITLSLVTVSKRRKIYPFTYCPAKSPGSRPLRSALKRPVAPPPLDISEPSPGAPLPPPSRPPGSQYRLSTQLPLQSQPAKPNSNPTCAISPPDESENAPQMTVDYEDTPFGPVPIYEPQEDHSVLSRRRKRSQGILGPPQTPMEGLEIPPPLPPLHSSGSDSSERQHRIGMAVDGVSQTEYGLVASPSGGPTPISASYGGFGGKASDIRNRILNERGGRA